MPLDVDRILGASLPEAASSWIEDDVILYHLALGAGAVPDDPGELEYVYESKLKVLPSFAALPATLALLEMLRMDGIDADTSQLLHGEHDLELHEALAGHGRARTSAKVTGVHDKGGAALVVLETNSRSPDDDRLLFTNRSTAVFRGEGGFGGGAGYAPSIEPTPPERSPDRIVTCPTLPQQALLYRLCADKHPLHVDPDFARRAGFAKPILQGLCCYGIVCKALVDTMLAGRVEHVSRFRGRFAGVLTPGETLEISIWKDDRRVLATARCLERDALVLSHVALELRPA